MGSKACMDSDDNVKVTLPVGLEMYSRSELYISIYDTGHMAAYMGGDCIW